jgi:hypothetical protein
MASIIADRDLRVVGQPHHFSQAARDREWGKHPTTATARR